jgi:hypothetical protein
VKYVILLAAILLAGVAVGVHPAFAGRGGPDRRPSRGAERSAAPVEGEPLRAAAAAVLDQPEVAPKAKGPLAERIPAKPKSAEKTKVVNVPWRNLAALLQKELSLAPLQQGFVEQILRERLEEIRNCHEEIRKSRVLDVALYDWQVARMKESWYRRVDGVLDPAQHLRFVALVEKGLFNEGLGVMIETDMTVLD